MSKTDELKYLLNETDKLKYLMKVKSKLNDEINQLNTAVNKKKEELEFIDIWLTEFQICPSCNGHGGNHVSYACDDVRLEICQTCKGSGLVNLKKFKPEE